MAGPSVVAVAALAAVFLIAGGLGYACSSGALGAQEKSPTSSIQLSWTSPVATSRSPSYVGCTASYTDQVLSLRVTDLAPGASCTLSGTIKNMGDLPASLHDLITLTHSPACLYFAYSDNLAGLATSPVVDSGHLFDYRSVFSLGAKAGNSCEGSVATVTVAISGSNACLSSPVRSTDGLVGTRQ